MQEEIPLDKEKIYKEPWRAGNVLWAGIFQWKPWKPCPLSRAFAFACESPPSYSYPRDSENHQLWWLSLAPSKTVQQMVSGFGSCLFSWHYNSSLSSSHHHHWSLHCSLALLVGFFLGSADAICSDHGESSPQLTLEFCMWQWGPRSRSRPPFDQLRLLALCMCLFRFVQNKVMNHGSQVLNLHSPATGSNHYNQM